MIARAAGPIRVVLPALLTLLLAPLAHTTSGQRASVPSTTKPAYANVESQLSDLVQEAVRGGTGATARLAVRAPISDGARVAVTVYVSGDPAATAGALERRGAVIANVDTGLVEAYIDLQDIPDASELPGVTRVALIRSPLALGGPALPRSAVGRGSVVSEAVTVHNAARQHLAGITGRGVKVGVIDTGFDNLRTIRNDGELPPTIRGRCYWRVGRFNSRLDNCELGTEHGTAVAEALLDVAPGVTLYISNPQSFTDLRRTMRWMANQGGPDHQPLGGLGLEQARRRHHRHCQQPAAYRRRSGRAGCAVGQRGGKRGARRLVGPVLRS